MIELKHNFIFLLFFLGAFLFLSKETLALSCARLAPFLETVELSDLVVRGNVLAHYPRISLSSPRDSMEIEVLESYKGTMETAKIQVYETVFGPSISTFPIGTEWILAVRQVNKGTENLYLMFNDCWESYLKVENSVVGYLKNIQAPIQNTLQIVSLDEFQKILQGTESSQLLTYDDGVQEGRQQCMENPIACGIRSSICSQKASYEPTSGKLFLPCVKVSYERQEITLYEMSFTQRTPAFTFDLDFDTVRQVQETKR